MKQLLIIISIIFCSISLYSKEFIKAKVIYVTDGDTIIVNLSGKKEKIRLTGIDCPESRNNFKTRRDSKRNKKPIKKIIEQGRRATKFVRSLVKKGSVVSLELDLQERDRYGRILAYVYLPDGRMLNEVIVISGFATVMTIPPNIKYRDMFINAYRKARENRVGLWK